MPASLSSCGSRPCNVPNIRSDRPLASGVPEGDAKRQ
jgi:hypothetical protein